LLGCNFFKYS